MPRRPFQISEDMMYDPETREFISMREAARAERFVNPRRTRTKDEYPYSYDEFFHYGTREDVKRASGADYSDRLYSWDTDKFDELWGRHVGQKRFGMATTDELSAFMSAYHGKTLKVTALAEGCNAGNGFPYFVVWYREVK